MSATKGSWSWQRNSRASHPWNRVVACKSKNLELVFNWWVFCCSPCFFWNVRFLFVSSWFELFSFLSRKLWLVFVVLWKRFFFSMKKIWFLKLGIGHWKLWNWNLNFLDLRFWIEIWNLKFETLRLGLWNLIFWKIETWNFENL